MGVCCCKSNDTSKDEQRVALLGTPDVVPKVDVLVSETLYTESVGNVDDGKAINASQHEQKNFDFNETHKVNEENMKNINIIITQSDIGNTSVIDEGIDETNQLLNSLTELNLDELDSISSSSSLIYRADICSSSESQELSLSPLSNATEPPMIDQLENYLLSKGTNHQKLIHLFQFIGSEEYDTESIYYDITQKLQSNIYDKFSSNIYEHLADFQYTLLPLPNTKKEKKIKKKKKKGKKKKNKKKKKKKSKKERKKKKI